MKKNIALLLSIIALILLISFLRVNIDKEYLNPAGNIISDGIYAYDLQTNGLSVNGLTTKKEELFINVRTRPRTMIIFLSIKKIKHLHRQNN